MSTGQVRVGSGVAHEVVGNEVIVHLPGTSQDSPSTVVQLSRESADIFIRAVDGDEDLTSDSEHVSELVSLGVLVTDSASTVSRRTALVAGAAGLGAGITLLSLPQAAVASSVVELQGNWSVDDGDPQNPILQFFSAHNYGVDPATVSPPLTVVGISGDIPYLTRQDNFGGPGRTRIIWRRELPEPASDSTFVGSFSLGGVNYRVTFEPFPPD